VTNFATWLRITVFLRTLSVNQINWKNDGKI